MAEARATGEELAGMLRIEARGAGRYAATPESFWGATARGDLLARMALAAIAEAGAAPTSLHASFLADRNRTRRSRSGATRRSPRSGAFTSSSAARRSATRCSAFPTTDLTLHDFALWIHRPARWDDFWLVTTRTDVGVAGRGFSRREIATREGELIASAAWELSACPPRV